MLTLAGVTLGASFFMVWTAHPVYMVVSLVLVSLGLGALTVGVGAQFVGLVVVLVYVGAVNVLFLFVIMMINLRIQRVTYLVEHSWWAALAVGAVLVTHLGGTEVTLPEGYHPGSPSRLATLGGYMFSTGAVLPDLVVGLALLVAMLAAICLTMVSGEIGRAHV